jgi:hypothetical protein
MYKALFQNSKAALIFAGLTIFGAAAMVGSSEEKGMVSRVADLVASQRQTIADEAEQFAESQSVGDAPSAAGNADAGWGSDAPAFSDYETDESEPGVAPVAPKSARPGPTGSVAAILPKDYVVPEPGADGFASQPVPQPVITKREMTITPN